jgi:hypothetical protein
MKQAVGGWMGFCLALPRRRHSGREDSLDSGPYPEGKSGLVGVGNLGFHSDQPGIGLLVGASAHVGL